jgi:hypothetical protein
MNMGVVEAPALTYDDLNPVEQAAASLGVQPDSVKPISWMNEAHHAQLKKSNALGPELARRIEAYRSVAKSSIEAGH